MSIVKNGFVSFSGQGLWLYSLLLALISIPNKFYACFLKTFLYTLTLN